LDAGIPKLGTDIIRGVKLASCLLAIAMLGLGASVARAQTRTTILFIGNSFTYGLGSAVRFYRADTVTDLNDEGIGGVPALFKSFADQAGIDYDVYLETRGNIGLDYHLENKLDVIGTRPWDVVVMHGHSTLDPDKPGDPTKLIATSREMAEFLRAQNPKVAIHLMATWARAEQTAREVRAAYDKAAAGAGAASVIPVGEAWTRAMQSGVADPNPFDGIEAQKLNLWTYDNYHASTYGYYLQALVIFGSLTGRDPRSLGENECSAYELGMASREVKALQQVAFDQLAAAGSVTPAPLLLPKPVEPVRCGPAH
jgi:hypothetical protein